MTPNPRSEAANRALNLVLAAVALVLLAPLMLLIALMVKLTSPGPVIYCQERVGLNRRSGERRTRSEDRHNDQGGNVFCMYKFRSMRVDAEEATGPVWAARGDARTTPIGRWLRELRLDELPQFANVLKGDMNIVGPRPERPGIFARLREDVPGYALRQAARPGITGWAQVHCEYDTCVEDVNRKVAHDLEYLRRQSLREDLSIMWRTIPVVLFRRGGW